MSGIPAPLPPEQWTRFRELWELGLSDRAISEVMKLSESATRKRRVKLGLSANPGAHATLDRARAENEAPWKPLPGMTKLRCEDCAFWFAARGGAVKCPDCLVLARRQDQLTGTASPACPAGS